MGKVILLEHVSLDGFLSGPNGEMGWVKFDEELESIVTAARSKVDATIYGRVTYEIMEKYWPNVLKNPNSPPNQMDFARWVDKKLKVVVSKTLSKVEWNNTKIIKDDLKREINQLKKELEGDLFLIGSPTLVWSFLKLNLIDEFMININPILIGKGKPLFNDIQDKVNLKLIDAKQLNSGITALRYNKIIEGEI